MVNLARSRTEGQVEMKDGDEGGCFSEAQEPLQSLGDE